MCSLGHVNSYLVQNLYEVTSSTNLYVGRILVETHDTSYSSYDLHLDVSLVSFVFYMLLLTYKFDFVPQIHCPLGTSITRVFLSMIISIKWINHWIIYRFEQIIRMHSKEFETWCVLYNTVGLTTKWKLQSLKSTD